MGDQAPPDRPPAYDMASVANALPQTTARAGGDNRGPPTQPHPRNSHHVLQQFPQMAPYSGQPPLPSQFYHQGHLMPQYYPENTSQRPGANFYQPHLAMAPAPGSYYYQQPAGTYHDMRTTMLHQRTQGPYEGLQQSGDSRSHNTPHESRGMASPVPTQFMANGHTEANSGSSIRGPPRRPKRSDHAIWIGNLPPQTDLMSLVQHVCTETSGLQSLFLISKSNCAFANYGEATSSAAAQQKLHDSRFQTVRLVCRIRRIGSDNPSSHTIPAETASRPPTVKPPPNVQPSTDPDASTPTAPIDQDHSTASPQRPEPGVRHDKFFILKSLTVTDLDTSVTKGVWATQPHNERILNDAFQNQLVDNVFLIFSANKSGEYFGYAKMLSQIDQDPAAAIEFAPANQTSSGTDLPRTIETEATETMPRGKIIDDTSRGTIFWEIESDDTGDETDDRSEVSVPPATSEDEPEKLGGKPFKLEWLSTARLPFHRCRGLRNPWNSNREVKIARDGTELEPSIGRTLIGLFNSVQIPGPMGPMMRPPPPMGVMAGYSHMRPYGH